MKNILSGGIPIKEMYVVSSEHKIKEKEMAPAEMEELAKWHAVYGQETEWSARHAQSAAIIRWAAKVLQAEPVAYMNPESRSEDYAFAFPPASASWSVPLYRLPEHKEKS